MLKENLEDWMDIDIASHYLAVSLGLVRDHFKMDEFKSIYWSDNDLGNGLVKVLDSLVESGFLLKRDEPDYQYKWSGIFDACYESTLKDV